MQIWGGGWDPISEQGGNLAQETNVQNNADSNWKARVFFHENRMGAVEKLRKLKRIYARK